MTDSTSRSHDPDFQDMLAQSGMQHMPEQGDELMQQLAPLLSADGIDVDNLDDVDPSQLETAMARAIERHNLELMTPVSDERARTINTLRDISQALDAQQHDKAVEILGRIGPEAEEGLPSAGHVTGVAMESLDAWYASGALQNGSARVSQREAPRSVRKITPDVEALARKGRAYRSIGSLLRRNPESAVVGAGAYMVAAAVAALAEHREASFDDVLNELLPAQQVAEAPAAKPAAEPAAESAVKQAPAKEAPAAQPKPAAKTQEKAADTAAPADDQTDVRGRYTAIVETRFMAGVKEFQQWMGDSHPVTGTGLPKRADIQDVAATIGIEAEGVAKKQDPAEAPASDTDLNVVAGTQPTRYVQSAQALPELMAFLEALQEFQLIEVLSTKVQPGARAQAFGFEDFEQLDAAEELVATYVRATLTYATEGDAAARTAQFALGNGDVDETLIPRLRQLEAMDLIAIQDGTVVIPAPLNAAVRNGLEQAAQHSA
ncbi:hypothetical protein [Yaniella halotolerans]|uniref:hypothetical protein n=1 Tax=Yaniella halotolerans TaxID=225453 RepID=UPI0003B49EE7|nr:hypothetical protein [Yaniella halotolerans]